MNQSTEQIIVATVKLFFKVPRHTPVDPNWNQKNIHSVSRVWPCRVSWELWCYLKSITYLSMSKDLQGKQMAEPQISGALSPKAQKIPERSFHHDSFCLLFLENSHQMLAIPSAWQELRHSLCSPSFGSFSGLIPLIQMDANIFLSQCLYFFLDAPSASHFRLPCRQ